MRLGLCLLVLTTLLSSALHAEDSTVAKDNSGTDSNRESQVEKQSSKQTSLRKKNKHQQQHQNHEAALRNANLIPAKKFPRTYQSPSP